MLGFNTEAFLATEELIQRFKSSEKTLQYCSASTYVMEKVSFVTLQNYYF